MKHEHISVFQRQNSKQMNGSTLSLQTQRRFGFKISTINTSARNIEGMGIAEWSQSQCASIQIEYCQSLRLKLRIGVTPPLDLDPLLRLS